MSSRPFARGLSAVAFLAAIAVAAPARPGVELRVEATARLDDATRVTVAVTNAGDEAATAVRADATLRARVTTGELLATLAPGTSHEWALTLSPPDEPGSFAVFIEVHALDAAGARLTVPTAVVVQTPGLVEPAVRLTASGGPVARSGNVAVVIDNAEPTPLYGRLVIMLPTGLDTEPRARGVPVPPQGRADAVILVQSRGASLGRTYPAVAVFEYTLAERRHAVLARTTIPVVAAPSRTRPLLVGAGALALAFAALALALRQAARRRAAAA